MVFTKSVQELLFIIYLYYEIGCFILLFYEMHIHIVADLLLLDINTCFGFK